jgi:hypothetical protein
MWPGASSRLERAVCVFLGELRDAERVVVLGPGDLASAPIVPPLIRPVLRQRVRACETAHTLIADAVLARFVS